MRLSFVATPASLPDGRPAPGSLDGDAMRARLSQPDAGFRVVDLDPNEDLAVQLEDFFDREAPASAEALFVVSAPVVLSVEGEPFVCLNPLEPETGDSIKDLALVLSERVSGAVTFVLECRHAPDPTDPFRSAAVVAAVKDAIASAASGIELLVAAHPAIAEPQDKPSAFTRAILRAMEEGGEALSARGLYERLHDSEQLLGIVPSFAYVRGRTTIALLSSHGGAGALTAEVDEGFEALASAPHPGAPTSDEASTLDAPTLERLPAEAAAVDVDEAPPNVGQIFAKLGDAPVPDDDPTFVDEPPSERAPRSTKMQSVPPTALPPDRVFLKAPDDVPRVVIGDPTPSSPPPAVLPPVSSRPPPSSIAPPPVSSMPPPPEGALAPEEYVRESDAVAGASPEAALVELKRALATLPPTASAERADVFVRIASVKRGQGKRREAIANLEKALALVPGHRPSLEALLDLDVAEGDWKAVSTAEDRLIGMIADKAERRAKLVEFGDRWLAIAHDDGRAQRAYERARAEDPEDRDVLAKLVPIYDRARAFPEALATRRRIAELTPEPSARAEAYADAAKFCLLEMKKEDLALELFDLALDTDPAQIDPLAVVARILADRQEWSELERAYGRMLDRAPRITVEAVRAEVTYELCRRLGLLYRDHLEDPALALDAFEDGLDEKPGDLNGHLVAADLAKSLGELERAAVHLQSVARLEPARIQTYHDLFEIFQRTKRPDQAYAAASVTSLAKVADARERIIFEEHRPEGVPKLARALGPASWDLLRVGDREQHVEAVLAAIAPAAIAAKLAQLASEKRLPALDPAARQDPKQTTVSVVRSFAWASHFLAVPAPAVYLNDALDVAIAAVPAEEPSVIAGGAVLRGRSLPELAFLVGRHLAYHVGWHRLLLYFPSIEELSTCFLAGVAMIERDLPVPAKLKSGVLALRDRLEATIGGARQALSQAVRDFQRAGSRGDLARLVRDVERCSARAGYLLSGDLDVARSAMKSDQHGLTDLEAKLADLFGFAVSDEYHALREELGIAIAP